MDTIEAIMTRRSIRKFDANRNNPLPDGAIEQALRAAVAAPNAGNQQPWHFIIVKDRDTLEKIPELHAHARMSRQALAGVLFVGDPSNERFGPFWPQDMAACVQNFLLAVHTMGLAACWTGIYPREQRTEDFREFFGIPDGLIPFAFVPVGWPAEEKQYADRFDPSRIHSERW